MILLISNDPIFLALLEQTALAEQADVLVLSGEETLWAALREATPDLILVDMALSGADGPDLVHKLKQNPATQSIPLVAFGSSLRADLLQDALDSGADKALSKSAFREQMTGLIRHFSKP